MLLNGFSYPKARQLISPLLCTRHFLLDCLIEFLEFFTWIQPSLSVSCFCISLIVVKDQWSPSSLRCSFKLLYQNYLTQMPIESRGVTGELSSSCTQAHSNYLGWHQYIFWGLWGFFGGLFLFCNRLEANGPALLKGISICSSSTD